MFLTGQHSAEHLYLKDSSDVILDQEDKWFESKAAIIIAMQRLKNGIHECTFLSGFTVMIHQYSLHRWRTLQQMRLCKKTINLDFSYIGAVVEISSEW